MPRAISDKPDGLLWLLLGQRDREVTPEGLALPLVAGVATQLDVDHEGLRLAGLKDAEVPAVCGQLGHRNERRLTGGGADADSEVLVGDGRVGGTGGVGEGAAEVGGRRDAAGVGDGEPLRDELTRLQVVEVERDRPAVVLVADAEYQRSGVDVDAGGLLVVEGRAGAAVGSEAEGGNDADTDDGTDGAVALGTGVLNGHCGLVERVGRVLRGHYVPFLQLSCVGCI